jgi:plastocyanin
MHGETTMRTLTSLFAAASLLAFTPHAQAAEHVVHVGGSGLVFTPSSIEALVGDTVTFTNDGGVPNVISDVGAPMTFRCANGCDGVGTGDGTPSGTVGWTATITISPAAAHSSVGYHCEVHGQVMSGSITVTNPVDLQSFDID